MDPRRSSLTAEVVAAGRAIESYRPESLRLFQDPFASAFVTMQALRLVVGAARLFRTYDACNWLVDRRMGVFGQMLSFCCRTRCIDDALRDALRAGCRQVVILGAGYDCRAYRISGIEGTAVFEVDQPVTQQFKRARLEKLLRKIPPHVTFVPVDFDHEGLAQAMELAGFRSGERTFFILEGVTQYITREAVQATVRFVADTSAAGSQLVFTYIHRGAIDGSAVFKGAETIATRARSVGEPWVFGLLPEEVPQFVEDCGLALIADWGDTENRARYLDPRGRTGPLTGYNRTVLAEVKGTT